MASIASAARRPRSSAHTRFPLGRSAPVRGDEPVVSWRRSSRAGAAMGTRAPLSSPTARRGPHAGADCVGMFFRMFSLRVQHILMSKVPALFSSGHATSRTLSGSQSWYQKTFATHRLTQSESVERDVRGVSTEQCQNDVVPHGAPGMTLRARGAPRRRGDSPRRKEEGTVKVCPEAGRGRRLMPARLGAPAGGPVQGERRAPAAGSRAFIKDAGRRLAVIPHDRPGHADLAVRGTRPADPRCVPAFLEGSARPERFVGIDVALRDHRVAVLDRDGVAVGQRITTASTKCGRTITLPTYTVT